MSTPTNWTNQSIAPATEWTQEETTATEWTAQSVAPATRWINNGGEPTGGIILLESGYNILLENGYNLLLE